MTVVDGKEQRHCEWHLATSTNTAQPVKLFSFLLRPLLLLPSFASCPKVSRSSSHLLYLFPSSFNIPSSSKFLACSLVLALLSRNKEPKSPLHRAQRLVDQGNLAWPPSIRSSIGCLFLGVARLSSFAPAIVMAQSSSRPQAAPESSHCSPDFSGRLSQAAPSQTSQEHDFFSQGNLSPLHHCSHMGDMEGIETPRATGEDRRNSMLFVGQSAPQPRGPSNLDAAGRRGLQPMTLTSIVCDESSPGHNQKNDTPRAIFGDSQQYPDSTTQQTNMAYRGNADLDWRSGPGEVMRNSHYTSSPIKRYVSMASTHPRMSFGDELIPGGGSDPAVGANGARRISGPPGVISPNHEASRFGASAAMYPYDGGDYPCRCTPEPPRPRNSKLTFSMLNSSP